MKNNSKDFFQSINEYQHNIGIYLTYTLDNAVIDKLSEVATGTKLILHDYTQGKTLDENLGSTLVCIPIKTLKPNDKNCFHSKLAFLKSKTGAKFIVGSANLSTSSFESLEPNIALELELDFKNETDVFIYNQILIFFEQLIGTRINREGKRIDENGNKIFGKGKRVIDETKRQILILSTVFEETIDRIRTEEKSLKESDIQFVFNSHDKSIFDEYKNYLTKYKNGQKAKRLKIATPFVSKEYYKMGDVKSIAKDISIYLRNGAKIKPFENHFKIFQPKNKKRDRFHSKLFLAEYDTDAVLFIGSANFTEQGFFKTLAESANQECGIILNLSLQKLQEMQDWFSDSYWNLLSKSEIENYDEAKGNSLEFFESQKAHYAWAERVNNKIITYIYNPKNYIVSKTKGGGELNLIKMNDDFLFQTSELKMKNEKVEFYIGEKKISVSVFELNEYINGLNEKGESVFYEFNKMRSINQEELKQAIEKEGVTISSSSGIKLRKPALYEKQFKNIYAFSKYLASYKYPLSDYKVKEIETELEKADSASNLFFAYQLLNELQLTNKHPSVQQVCNDALIRILNTDEYKSVKENFLNLLCFKNDETEKN